MVRGYFNRGVLDATHSRWEAAIKDFEEAGKLQPNAAEVDRRLYLIYRAPRSGHDSQVRRQFSAKDQTGPGRTRGSSAEFILRPKRGPELRPDADLDPLDKAKAELLKKLDATAEK